MVINNILESAERVTTARPRVTEEWVVAPAILVTRIAPIIVLNTAMKLYRGPVGNGPGEKI